MDRPCVFAKSLRRRSASIVPALVLLVLTVLVQAAPSQTAQSSDDTMMRHLVEYFMRVGQEQYQRGYYIQAEKTFQMAQGYKDCLDPLERRRLGSLLEKAGLAAVERRGALESKQAAVALLAEGQAVAARAHLEKIKDNEFLTENERLEVAALLEGTQEPAVGVTGGDTVASPATPEAGDALNRYRNSVAELYYESVKAYYAGDFEVAKGGLTKVLETGLMPAPMAETIRGYLAEIERRRATPENGRPVVLADETAGTLPTMTAADLGGAPRRYAAANDATASPSQTEAERIEALYNRSWELYSAGELEAARRGFVEVRDSGLFTAPEGKRAEDYIATIDRLLAAEVSLLAPPPSAPQPEMMSAAVPTANQGAEGAGSFIDVINRRRNIIRSHTRAVVNDAVNAAQKFMAQGEFDKASEVVYNAQRIVNQNQLHLGDELYKQYTARLTELAERIGRAEETRKGQLAEQRRQEAIEAQRDLRSQAEMDRQQKIDELMERAKAYQRQQRYEAALGQVESVLAIEPLHDEALTLRQTLEDMVYLRKQIDLEKESNKQRVDLMLETEEAQTPYAPAVTYPKDWREIIKRPTRQPDKPMILDAANIKVYEQLEEIVDLSMLSPEMPFSEAIEILKKTVEPPLNVVVLWNDLLDTADIAATDPINMDPLTNVRLGTALENLLNAVAGGFAQLDYIVSKGVITVATVEGLPAEKMETRVYDVSDLLGEPANYRGMGGMMGMMGGMGGMMGGMGGYGGMGGMGGMMGGMGGMMGGMGGYGGGMGGYGGGMGGYGGGMGGYGGGMGGYGGGMGGYGGGMGGYGGGMGGYGGGMGGYGGMGGMGGMMGGMGGYGGMMGGMGGMMGGYMSRFMAMNLRQLIQESIEPESWFELSDYGEGTIMVFPQDQPKKLAIYQTPEVHNQIAELLDELRESLGHQVSIEARFLIVSENFLEEVGLDVDFRYDFGGKWGIVTFEQESAEIGASVPTGVPGGLGGSIPALEAVGGYGTVLDDLQVSFILRATQARTDAKSLAAPKVTVLSGESASFYLMDEVSYALPPTQTAQQAVGGIGAGVQQQGVYQNIGILPVGSTLSITPTISKDKKNVLLNIMTNQQDLLGFRRHTVEQVVQGQGGVGQAVGEVIEYQVEVPEREISNVMTRVSVPDRGTLLLGGHKVTAEVEKEAGVPVLSKIPVVGRLFSNRSKVRDQKIMLILVKPTILLQEEEEQQAIAAMEESTVELQY